jgi:hypothetical protein
MKPIVTYVTGQVKAATTHCKLSKPARMSDLDVLSHVDSKFPRIYLIASLLRIPLFTYEPGYRDLSDIWVISWLVARPLDIECLLIERQRSIICTL